jgi:hypothetical protein
MANYYDKSVLLVRISDGKLAEISMTRLKPVRIGE